MNDAASPDTTGIDAALQRLAAASEAFMARCLQGINAPGGGLPYRELLTTLGAAFAREPGQLAALQSRWLQRSFDAWHATIGGRSGAGPADGSGVAPDRRFRAPEWRELPYFDYVRRLHGIATELLHECVDRIGADDFARRRLRFFAQQLLDAVAPSNYLAANPEVIRLAYETAGKSLAGGLANLLADGSKGRISMTDESAFTVGGNLATTPGAVVLENALIQLIQYAPSTPDVFERPLLVVPPCINKYYILDLQPQNSFVRHAVERGHTVFMISWRNVPETLGHTSWDDYLSAGVIAAIDAARKASGATKINALGFCVGGTLLACALAVLRARRRAPVASLTLLTTMLDFADPGDIQAYIDESYVRQVEERHRDGGLMPGGQLAMTFASLRANDLIWPYVVNNYLKGRTPDAFDLLYWNSDSANLAGRMYAYYLRNMYFENRLREPGALVMNGVPVDLGRIGLPAYVLAAREDHIVPWRSAYASARLLSPHGGRAHADVDFVLAASGHIAGVINPAGPNRRSHWTGNRGALRDIADPQEWLASAEEHPGSWWHHWGRWIDVKGGRRVPAPTAPGGGRLPAIEPAPGRYVLERCASDTRTPSPH
jgi:polyhydroxyalkanoate synthase